MIEKRDFFKTPQEPTIDELVYWFVVNFPKLAEDMKQSYHENKIDEPNPYHLEGDVFAHTMMVCLRAENENSNKVVKISALLHDIGKPEARDLIPLGDKKPVYNESNSVRNNTIKEEVKEGNVHTHFRGHEGLSFYKAIEILNRLEECGVVNRLEKERVLIIVSLHGVIFDNIKEGQEYKPEKIVKKFNDIQTYRDFIAQVKNDSTGRFFVSTDGRKNQAFALGNTIYTDNTFRKWHKPVEIDKDLPKITLLVGPPCSGKSFFRDKQQGVSVISRDDLLLEFAEENGFNGNYSEIWKWLEETNQQKEIDKIEQKRFREAVKNKDDIIIDRTNMSAKSRRKWLNNVTKDYTKEAIVFATEYDEIYARNENRALKTGKTIPKYVISKMMKQFTIPTYAEVDSVKFEF